MDKHEFIESIMDIIENSDIHDADDIRSMIDNVRCDYDNSKKQKINIFYDEIKKVLEEHYQDWNHEDKPIHNMIEGATALNDLFNRFYEQLREDFNIVYKDNLDGKKEIIEKLQNENKSLSQDIYMLSTENAKLKTKLNMVKILVENEKV